MSSDVLSEDIMVLCHSCSCCCECVGEGQLVVVYSVLFSGCFSSCLLLFAIVISYYLGMKSY